MNDKPEVIPASGWRYNDKGTAISLQPAGTAFVAGDIYEFSYTAKDPTVNGLGFAAVRDWNAFLKYETKDAAGTANPLAGDVTRIYTEVRSQPGRMLNDFRTLGFNQAENGRKVFDGMLQWIAAGDGINMNYRFSQPGRTERNRQDHLYVEGVFPFANVSTTDPVTGRTASRYDRCVATNTCPLAMEIYSANEYWVKAASLMHTDPRVPATFQTRRTRASTSSRATSTARATPRTGGRVSSFRTRWIRRRFSARLFLALDEWSVDGTLPPPSQVPRLADETLVRRCRGDRVSRDTGRDQQRPEDDPLSPELRTGLLRDRNRHVNPPLVTAPYQDNPANGPIYPSFVPKTDSDGNDVAGVRLPDVTVPLATYTGWALRARAQAGDGCEGSGQYIPFAKTKAERMASGDPRPSIEERYPSFAQYRVRFEKAVDDLVARRLMLREDVESNVARLLQAGRATGAIKDGPMATGSR